MAAGQSNCLHMRSLKSGRRGTCTSVLPLRILLKPRGGAVRFLVRVTSRALVALPITSLKWWDNEPLTGSCYPQDNSLTRRTQQYTSGALWCLTTSGLFTCTTGREMQSQLRSRVFAVSQLFMPALSTGPTEHVSSGGLQAIHWYRESQPP